MLQHVTFRSTSGGDDSAAAATHGRESSRGSSGGRDLGRGRSRILGIEKRSGKGTYCEVRVRMIRRTQARTPDETPPPSPHCADRRARGAAVTRSRPGRRRNRCDRAGRSAAASPHVDGMAWDVGSRSRLPAGACPRVRVPAGLALLVLDDGRTPAVIAGSPTTPGWLRCTPEGIKVVPTVGSTWSPDKAQAVFTSASLTPRACGGLVHLVRRYGFDGIDLDYEGFTWPNTVAQTRTIRHAYAAFVGDLCAELHDVSKMCTHHPRPGHRGRAQDRLGLPGHRPGGEPRAPDVLRPPRALE